MSSLRKNAIKPLDYESNPANPLGLSCILLKCRDLYTLSISSIAVFYDVFSNTENLIRLNNNFSKLAKRILDIPSCAWLLFMIYAAPHSLTLKVLEDLVGVFSTARKLPKGLNIRGARGKAHLSPDDHNSIIIASREAIRLTLMLSCQVTKTPLESRSPLWLLGLKLLTDDDIQQSVLAANLLLYELEINNKRLIIANELQIMINCLKSRVKKFEILYKEMTKYSKLLKSETREYLTKQKRFTEILFEITHMEHEHELDVPLEYYLKDHDDLRRAHESRMKAKQNLGNSNNLFKQAKGNYDLTFSSLRLISLLIARAIVLYSGLYLDTTSLLNLDPESTVPITNSLSADINPLIFGGYSSDPKLKNKVQKDALISSLLNDIPWKELASLICIERIVAGTCSIRLLAAVACKFSDVLQWKLLPWCRRALEDLLHQPRWYSITEDIPLYDAPLPQSKRELFRSLTIEEPPPPKAVYFNRITTLDTRISCVLVYWATRGNTHILTQCTRWYDITQHQQEREKLNIKEMSRGELSSKYLVWVQLLLHSEEKSKIIQDEQEYYSIHDPSRHFREMELKSLATKELVISDELDEDDLSDNSDSENEGSDEEEEEEEDEEEEEANLSEDSISNSKIPQNHRKIFLKPRHKKIYQQMLDDRYAMALLHLTASEYIDETNIPPDFILYEDSQKISKEFLNCSKFIHQELYSHIHKLLIFALEGPSDQEIFRYSHPYQILSSLLQQDTSIGLAQTIRQEIPISVFQYLIRNCLFLQEGIIDKIFRSNTISLLFYLFGGLETYYFFPSWAPMHQHTIPQTLIYRKERVHHENIDKLSALKLFSLCKEELIPLIEHICETIYKTSRDDLLPCGDNGRCYLSRIVRLLTVFADIDDILVWNTLLEAIEKRCNEVEKIQFWPSNCSISLEHMWLAPFILIFQGGTSKLVSVYRRTLEWKIPKVDEENYGNSVYRGYYDVCRQFAALLALLSSINDSVSLAIAENSQLIVPALITTLKAKDRILNQSIYRISTAIIRSATISVNSTSRCVPFDAPATYFRLLLFQEGCGLDIACEMTREVFCDLWGMTEPPPSMSSSSPLPNTATRSTQFLPPLLPASISKKETPSDIRKGSDRRFPSLGVKSGSLKTILQQTNNKLDHTAETTSISSNEAYIHHMINQTNLPVNLPVCNDPEEPNDDDDDDDGNEKEEDEKSNEDNEHEEVENTSEKNEDDDDDDDEKNHESDEDSIDSLSTIGIITEWNDRIKYEKMRIARDFILYTFECLVNICENRLELQDRIAEKSSFFFQSLYGILTPTTQHETRVAAILHDDDSVSIGEYSTHLGVIGSCAQVLRTLVKRHDKIRTLIRETSCIEGLIDALDVSYVINDKILGLYIVYTIEQLIIRNLEIWSYVKYAGGVKGLLQLCHMGNIAVRILACNDLIIQISSTKTHEKSLQIIDEILQYNGLLTILVMLHSQDSSVQTNALILLKNLCTHQLGCRRAILSSSKFIIELGSLLFSPDLSVIRVACEMMMILGAEDQFTLRKLVEAMNSTIQHVASIYGKNIIYCFGKNITIDKEEDQQGLTIKSRLIDIANGILSTQSISEQAFRIKDDSNIPNNNDTDPSYESKDIQIQLSHEIPPSNVTNTSYTTEYISKEGKYYDEPRYIQDIRYLSNLAANVLAAMTDAEEGNWPDGGAPLRQTMKVSGILPKIYDTSGRRRRSDNNILQYTT